MRKRKVAPLEKGHAHVITRKVGLEIHKKIVIDIVIDEDRNPIAVQIPIEEFERLEETIENYGLSKLMDEVRDEERLSLEDAKRYYQTLQKNVEG